MITVATLPYSADSIDPDFLRRWRAWIPEPWLGRLDSLLESRGMAHPHVRTITLFEPSGQAIATCLLDLPRPDIPSGWRVAWLSHVWTPEEHRGKGYAGELLRASFEQARLHGSEEVMLASSWPDLRRNVYSTLDFQRVTGSPFLMSRELAATTARPGMSGCRFATRLWADDLAVLVSILARQHFALHRGDITSRSPCDAEEILSARVADDLDLGHVVAVEDQGTQQALVCWVYREVGGEPCYLFSLSWHPESAAEAGRHLVAMAGELLDRCLAESGVQPYSCPR